MNFMFENFGEFFNIPTHPHRFRMSPMVSRITRFNTDPFKYIHHTDENYIIPIGVIEHPLNWCGLSEGVSLFELLTDEYVIDLREGRAILLIDNSHEGYQPKWLFHYFHESLAKLNLPPQCLVYLTGNAIVEDLYEDFCKDRGIKDKIKCICYALFEEEIFCNHEKVFTPDFNEHMRYKKSNWKKVLAFNCPQRKPRPHRREFFDLMQDNNLLDKGLCSFPEREVWIKGEVHDDTNPHNYVSRVHPEYALQTYVTVVSEPQYYKHELAVFNSEKVFKPISCFHPFIVLGGMGSLKALKKRGYKSFSNWFDESYDEIEDDKKRMQAIIDVLKYIDSIDNKLDWFESMKETLTHNYDNFVKRSLEPDVAFLQVEQYYEDYFNG